VAQTKIALTQGVVLFEGGGVILVTQMSISEKTIEWQKCPIPRFSLLYNVDDMPFGVFIYSGAAVSIYTYKKKRWTAVNNTLERQYQPPQKHNYGPRTLLLPVAGTHKPWDMLSLSAAPTTAAPAAKLSRVPSAALHQKTTSAAFFSQKVTQNPNERPSLNFCLPLRCVFFFFVFNKT
jgi:hypothetical protein